MRKTQKLDRLKVTEESHIDLCSLYEPLRVIVFFIGVFDILCKRNFEFLPYPLKLCAVSSLAKNGIGRQEGFTQNSKRVLL